MEEWFQIFHDLRVIFGNLDRHDGVVPMPGISNPYPDPTIYQDDPNETNGSFADDFSGIYNDLKTPLLLYDVNVPE